MKRLIGMLLLLMLLATGMVNATDENTQGLSVTLAALDAELFGGFNDCEPERMQPLIDEGIEFYHDKGGLTVGRDELLMSTYDRCSHPENHLRRELVEGSLHAYPMEGIGAVQTGMHRFHLTEGDQPEKLVEIAQFMHVWQLKDGKWSIIRAISYDHHAPE